MINQAIRQLRRVMIFPIRQITQDKQTVYLALFDLGHKPGKDIPLILILRTGSQV
jgi:hypothetical protein